MPIDSKAACFNQAGMCVQEEGAYTDVTPVLSSTEIRSPIPNEMEIGREEALCRRADHRLPA